MLQVYSKKYTNIQTMQETRTMHFNVNEQYGSMTLETQLIKIKCFILIHMTYNTECSDNND